MPDQKPQDAEKIEEPVCAICRRPAMGRAGDDIPCCGIPDHAMILNAVGWAWEQIREENRARKNSPPPVAEREVTLTDADLRSHPMKGPVADILNDLEMKRRTFHDSCMAILRLMPTSREVIRRETVEECAKSCNDEADALRREGPHISAKVDWQGIADALDSKANHLRSLASTPQVEKSNE